MKLLQLNKTEPVTVLFGNDGVDLHGIAEDWAITMDKHRGELTYELTPCIRFPDWTDGSRMILSGAVHLSRSSGLIRRKITFLNWYGLLRLRLARYRSLRFLVLCDPVVNSWDCSPMEFRSNRKILMEWMESQHYFNPQKDRSDTFEFDENRFEMQGRIDTCEEDLKNRIPSPYYGY